MASSSAVAATASILLLKTLSVNSMRIIEIKTIESVTAFFGHIFSFHSDYYYGYGECEYTVRLQAGECVCVSVLYVSLCTLKHNNICSPITFSILNINVRLRTFFLLLSHCSLSSANSICFIIVNTHTLTHSRQ